PGGDPATILAMNAAEERLRLEARQHEHAEERRAASLSWTEELLERPTPELIERAYRALGFRHPVEHTLAVADLVRLVRGRSSAGWSFHDVEPLVLPPSRYRRIGRVIELQRELPSAVLSVDVAPRSTLAFEVGLDHREWVVETQAEPRSATSARLR